MTYFDSAYIAKCYLNEPGSERVRKLARGSSGILSSELGRLEFFTTLHRHLREGNITRREMNAVVREFEEDESNRVWLWIPLTSSLIAEACGRILLLPAHAYLRAGDALHLESARNAGCKEIYTNDRRMLEAARHFQLVGRNVLAA